MDGRTDALMGMVSLILLFALAIVGFHLASGVTLSASATLAATSTNP